MVLPLNDLLLQLTTLVHLFTETLEVKLLRTLPYLLLIQLIELIDVLNEEVSYNVHFNNMHTYGVQAEV